MQIDGNSMNIHGCILLDKEKIDRVVVYFTAIKYVSLALFVSMCEFRLVHFDHLIMQCTYSLIIARTNCFMKFFEIFELNSQTRASVYIFNFAVASALRPEINQFDRL